MDDKKESFNFIINKIMRVVKSANQRNQKLVNICEILKNDVSYYDWVGFYIADEAAQELTLGPFAGDPTEHTKIPFGKGICGQAVKKKETLIAQDVTKETNYLSCSPKVKSEIIVPIIKNNNIIGELDIDSYTSEPFSDDDKDFLENICNIITQLF